MMCAWCHYKHSQCTLCSCDTGSSVSTTTVCLSTFRMTNRGRAIPVSVHTSLTVLPYWMYPSLTVNSSLSPSLSSTGERERGQFRTHPHPHTHTHTHTHPHPHTPTPTHTKVNGEGAPLLAAGVEVCVFHVQVPRGDRLGPQPIEQGHCRA